MSSGILKINFENDPFFAMLTDGLVRKLR